jgi:hypothetical protein
MSDPYGTLREVRLSKSLRVTAKTSNGAKERDELSGTALSLPVWSRTSTQPAAQHQ